MDFLKYRYIFLSISLSIIIVGFIYGFNSGFKFDIDFKGGTRIEADLKKDFTNEQIESIVKNITGSVPIVQKVSSGVSSVSITTDVITEEISNKVVAALKTNYPNIDEPSIKNVQPAFGKELIQSAILALVLSLFIILIYVAIRFKTLGTTAAVTAIIALFHDVLIIIALYGVFKFPINSTFVAVILTVIGYSINDTIIVYDRIRENKRKVTKSANLKDTINGSLNQTIKRTIYTSVTTITAITVVYIFAYFNNQQVLKDFSLPLAIGILSGTYSSIFVASSLWYIFEGFKKKKVR